ncbi:hypothetical protein V1517DRAFT_375804 [Lipomyces orientalis]|uniref:Uncharacterized protein n=1 Tax=Lipomyces orientalis TaxID=1233043 RepID=A0ACC3TH75_9ASCO
MKWTGGSGNDCHFSNAIILKSRESKILCQQLTVEQQTTIRPYFVPPSSRISCTRAYSDLLAGISIGESGERGRLTVSSNSESSIRVRWRKCSHRQDYLNGSRGQVLAIYSLLRDLITPCAWYISMSIDRSHSLDGDGCYRTSQLSGWRDVKRSDRFQSRYKIARIQNVEIYDRGQTFVDLDSDCTAAAIKSSRTSPRNCNAYSCRAAPGHAAADYLMGWFRLTVAYNDSN